MQKSTKAALLSALVFPGLGHLYLKKYPAAILLIGVSLAAIWYLIAHVMQRAIEISDRIRTGEVSPDIGTVTRLVSEQSASADTTLLNLAAAAFLICWILGIIDCLRRH